MMAPIRWLLENLFLLLLLFVEFILSLLPDMPTIPDSDFSPLAAANDVLPIAELFQLLPIFATIYTYVGFYKLMKFIRGAG